MVKTKAGYYLYLGLWGRGMWELSGIMVMFSILVEIWVTQVYTFVRTKMVGRGFCLSAF